MNHAIFWFRNDLRLADNLALLQACEAADTLLPVYIFDSREQEQTPWGFVRQGGHRRAVLHSAVRGLDAALGRLGRRLLVLEGDPRQHLLTLYKTCGCSTLYTEEIAAPQEQADIVALRAEGIRVHCVWQSSMIAPSALPFSLSELPDVFTSFRKRIEADDLVVDAPRDAPTYLPPWPSTVAMPEGELSLPDHFPSPDMRSAFPYFQDGCRVDEAGAQKHLSQYFARRLPHSYKATRNQLIGQEYSSKWSPYLALGVLSARKIMQALRAFEAEHGANEGSYWLWFELLWRDYFRFLHLKYGVRLYRATGLSPRPKPTHNPDAFVRWIAGQTGHPLIDAAMRELCVTGYLSNRMRQVAASYLIHELACDWRAGAAWFEAQLIDFDIYSNQGNWLYLAGYGTDPRGGRRFNPDKQAADYDADSRYRTLWQENLASAGARG